LSTEGRKKIAFFLKRGSYPSGWGRRGCKEAVAGWGGGQRGKIFFGWRLQGRPPIGCRRWNPTRSPLAESSLKEGLGVLLPGMAEDLCGRARLDDAAVLHDDDLIGEGPDHPQIVGDKHVGHGVAPLQIFK
jgi:hypothetical protein